jgi:hypothetical protein
VSSSLTEIIFADFMPASAGAQWRASMESNWRAVMKSSPFRFANRIPAQAANTRTGSGDCQNEIDVKFLQNFFTFYLNFTE